MSDQSRYRQRMQASTWWEDDSQQSTSRSTGRGGDDSLPSVQSYRQRMQASTIGDTSYPEGGKYTRPSRREDMDEGNQGGRFLGNPSSYTREQYLKNKHRQLGGELADQPMFGDPTVDENDRFDRGLPIPRGKQSKRVQPRRPNSVNPITGEAETYGDVARVDYREWNEKVQQKHISREERNTSQQGMIIPEASDTTDWDHVYSRRFHEVDTAQVHAQNVAERKANKAKLQKNAIILGDEEANDRWERNKTSGQSSTFRHGKKLGEFSDEVFLVDDPNYQPPQNRQEQVIAELTRKELEQKLMLQKAHKLPRQYEEPKLDSRVVDESKYRRNASHVMSHTLSDNSNQDYQRPSSTSRQDTYYRRNHGTPLFDSYNPGKDFDRWKRNDGPQNVDVQEQLPTNQYPHLAQKRADLLANHMGSSRFQRAQYDPAVANAPVPENHAPRLYAESSAVRKQMAQRSHNSGITFTDRVDESTIRRQARPVRVSQVFGAPVSFNPSANDGFKPNLNDPSVITNWQQSEGAYRRADKR